MVASTKTTASGTIPAPGSANATGLTTIAPQTAALANVSAAGPYDPNAYQPGASLAASQPSGTTPAIDDRYGSAPSTVSPPSVPPVSAPATTPIANAAPGDRYAMPATGTPFVPSPSASADRYATAPPVSSGAVNAQAGTAAIDPYGPLPGSAPVSPNTTGFASQSVPAESAANTAPATLSSAPATGFVAEPMAPAQAPAAATATAQIKSPVGGQYRPGGTSSYTSIVDGNRIDVASRPGAPATSPPSVPPSTTPPSDPWAPQSAPPTSTPPVRHGGSVSAGGSVF
jgi:ribonuclease E